MRAQPGAQDAGDHLRHRGLAVACRSRRSVAGAGGGRQAAASWPKRGLGIGHLDAGRGRPRRCRARPAPRRHPPPRPGPGSRWHRSARRAARRRGRPAIEAARVAVDPREFDVGCRRSAGRDGTACTSRWWGLADGHHRIHRPALSIRAAHALPRHPRNAAARRRLLVVLVALAGDEHDVPRTGFPPRPAAGPRGRSTNGPCAARPARWPASMSARICPGRLVARVVAGDDDALRQPRGDRPHQRALGAVAVTAAARTRRRAGRRAPAPVERAHRAPSPARRACAHSRHHLRQFAPVADPLHAARHRRDLADHGGNGGQRVVSQRAQAAMTASRLATL